MRPGQAISNGNGVDPVRDRLERLEALPLRASTARSILTRHGLIEPGDGPSGVALGGRGWELDDPGWSLAVSTRPMASDLDLVAASSWWPHRSALEVDAIDRLWRYSVATSIAAARLATEAGDPDPDAVARAGLLHLLGLWGLAAVASDRLSLWMSLEDDQARRRLEWSWFDGPLAIGGHRLAQRWGCDPGVADAALLAEESVPELIETAKDPIRLRYVRLGRQWADRTPWSLPGCRRERSGDDRSRWLVAQTQVRCSGGFIVSTTSIDSEPLIRSIATMAAEVERLKAEQTDRARRHETAVSSLRRRHAEDRAARQRATLEAMAEFAAGAAHELNNPLAVVTGRAQLLQARQNDPADRQALQTIIGQARRAHQILRDLMYVARPPSPRGMPCVPDQILDECVSELIPEAKARRVRLRQVTRPHPPSSWSDPDALRHMAEALLRNALESTPEGGSVVARSEGDERFLIWIIQDSGIGLDAERAAHLLNPFYCGRQAGRGLGLGLPRVARFLQIVGGTIRWQSVPEGGTMVRVDVPMPAPPVSPGDPPRTAQGDRERTHS